MRNLTCSNVNLLTRIDGVLEKHWRAIWLIAIWQTLNDFVMLLRANLVERFRPWDDFVAIVISDDNQLECNHEEETKSDQKLAHLKLGFAFDITVLV